MSTPRGQTPAAGTVRPSPESPTTSGIESTAWAAPGRTKNKTTIAEFVIGRWATTELGDAVADLADEHLAVAVARVLSRLGAIRDGSSR